MKLITLAKKIFLTPLGRRISRAEIQKARGMALLLVVISLALLTSVVTDLSYNETIRYQIAVHERDALKAEALAEGGIGIARLFLIIQGKIQPYIATFAGFGVPLPAYTIWELLPLEGDMLKNLTSGDLAGSLGVDVSEALQKREEKREQEAQEKKKSASSFTPPDGGFGAFDGSFDISIQDEESKISLRGWAATTDQKKRAATRRLLASLFSPKRYDDLFDGRGSTGVRVDRPSLIANIFDYLDIDEQRIDPYALDADWGRAAGGSEKDFYATTPDVMPKNAYLDSLDELRLVHGMTDGHMRAFGDAITIYGDEGKINILSAKDQVIEAVTSFCAANDLDPLLQNPQWVNETVKGWRDYQSQGLGPVSVQGFMNYLQTRGLTINTATCQSILDVKSSNFTLKSTATVNDVTRTLTLVTRVVNNAEELYYFRNN